MTRYDRSPTGWPDQNAVEPLEVEAEVFRNGSFAVRIVVSGEGRNTASFSRDDADRDLRSIVETIGPRIVHALRGCVVR